MENATGSSDGNSQHMISYFSDPHHLLKMDFWKFTVYLVLDISIAFFSRVMIHFSRQGAKSVCTTGCVLENEIN